MEQRSSSTYNTHEAEAGRTNTFSLEISSSLNLIIARFFNAPPVALPRLTPTPPCHNRSGVDRELWTERERFISKWLPKSQPHLYADEINIDALPLSLLVFCLIEASVLVSLVLGNTIGRGVARHNDLLQTKQIHA